MLYRNYNVEQIQCGSSNKLLRVGKRIPRFTGSSPQTIHREQFTARAIHRRAFTAEAIHRKAIHRKAIDRKAIHRNFF
jgi:hypothetical protein